MENKQSVNKIIYLILMLILFFAQNIVSQNINDIKIITEKYPPFNFVEQNKLQGISVDLIVEILKKMGSKKTRESISLQPWARGYSSLQTNKNTCLFSTTRTDEREKQFKWAGPIASTTISLIAKKGKNIKINNPENLKDYKIGVVMDDIGEALLIKNGLSKDALDRAGGLDALKNSIMKLEHDRVDLIAYEENVAMWTIKKNKLNSGNYETVYVLKEGELYYAFSKETDDVVVAEFQKALDSVKNDGTLQTILNKYLK